MDIFTKVRDEARGLLTSARGSHDWDHTKRVLTNCIRIGEKGNADMEILRLAAILHDIGRNHENESEGKICHAEKGAEMASELLAGHGLGQEKIDRIVHCIECHRFRNSKAPQSREAKILFDADKLDSIGAVGIGRAFLFAGEVGAKLHNHDVDIGKTRAYTREDTAYREYMVKLKKVNDRMLTVEGKRLAQERHDFMVNFFNRLNDEVDGQS